MKFLLVIVLFMSGCITSSRKNIEWMHSARSETLDEIAYNASNNAILCQNFIARIDSGQVTKEDIRFFFLANQQAWSETASNTKKLDTEDN